MEEGETDEQLIERAKQLCTDFHLYPADVCDAFIGDQGVSVTEMKLFDRNISFYIFNPFITHDLF